MGSCLGPAFGFIGGALQLGVWTEGEDKKPEGITSADPGWVGAWWIGFLVCGFASILCALPMFGFPKERFLNNLTGNFTGKCPNQGHIKNRRAKPIQRYHTSYDTSYESGVAFTYGLLDYTV